MITRRILSPLIFGVVAACGLWAWPPSHAFASSRAGNPAKGVTRNHPNVEFSANVAPGRVRSLVAGKNYRLRVSTYRVDAAGNVLGTVKRSSLGAAIRAAARHKQRQAKAEGALWNGAGSEIEVADVPMSRGGDVKLNVSQAPGASYGYPAWSKFLVKLDANGDVVEVIDKGPGKWDGMDGPRVRADG